MHIGFHLVTFGFAAAALTMTAPVAAQNADYVAQSPEVVSRGANGRATSVRIDGKEVKVCASVKDDSCIQPRAAGLNWGNRPVAEFDDARAAKRDKR